MGGQGLATSVYLHFPWCLRKCPYCDFASVATEAGAVPHEMYADAVIGELEERDVKGRTLVSVFVGGGTPSLWDARALGRALAAIRAAFDAPEPSVEVTVECNPTSLDEDKTVALREAGVGRLSIGVQSLDAERLRYLGRLHDPAEALDALRAAVATMPRVSADLMFGLPGQRAEEFERDLDRVLSIGVRHVSAYGLTIEPQTQFGELHRKGRLTLALEDDYAETFERAHDMLADRGLEHYEVSNFAMPKERSRHNEHYWRGGDYVGLGAGAVGALSGRRYRNDPRPERYLANPGRSEVFEEILDAQDRIREALMLGLRTVDGVDLAALEARAGENPRTGREAAIARRIERGDLRVDGDRWIVPQGRWLHLDGIIADLF